MTDSVTRDIHIDRAPAGVWKDLTQDFGTWFGVALDGPFAPGETTTGVMTEGLPGAPFALRTVEMTKPSRFAFDWPAYDPDAKAERADLPWTRVTFVLAPDGAGTRVTVTESGFDALPPELGARSLRCNTEGWEIQLRNLAGHGG